MRHIHIAKPIITKDEINEVVKVLKSGYLVYGKWAKKFEEEFSSYVGVPYAVATSNGTTALHAALWALGVKEGDEVITPALSFVASSNAALLVGAKPVFVDVDAKTYTIDPEAFEEAITSRTKAVVVVHLYGHPANMKKIIKIARSYDLYVVEDCAQAHGAEFMGKKVGSFGDLAAFSFYATKNMTTGEGGMVLTKSKKLAKKVRMIVDQGQSKKYFHKILGHNFRMTNLQAALGLKQLEKLDKWNEKRRRNAKLLTKILRDVKGVVTPFEASLAKHVYHQYVILARKRNELMRHLSKKGVGTAIHYPKPIYKQPLYRNLGYDLKLKNVESITKRALSLPVHPSLSKDDVKYVGEAVKEFYG